MLAAYRYAASDGPMPRELACLRYLDRFGAQAVFGRTIGAGEIRHMTAAENMVNAIRARDRAENWAAWELDNPREAAMIKAAMVLDAKESGENG